MMARLPRIIVPGQPVHLTQRGHNRSATFFDSCDYERYLGDLWLASRRCRCAIHAYVLMTNHVHLLLTPSDALGPSRLLQMVGRRFVRYINDRYQRSGTLWEGRFKTALIDSERYFLVCSRYIELNPVRARIVERPEEYRWSSYRHNAEGRHDPLITPHPLYDTLGEIPSDRQTAYCAMFANVVQPSELDELRDATNRGSILGDSPFVDRVEQVLDRPVRRRPHGGDRRSTTWGQSR